MKILLDTHAFLWIISDSQKLTGKAKAAYIDTDNRLFFSAASLWEISIKVSIGKLKLSGDWHTVIKKELEINGIQWLPIESTHCQKIIDLPFHHRDPFDRMLISQACCEEMAIITTDKTFQKYDVDIIW